MLVQQCIVHLVGNSFRYTGRQHQDAIVKSLRPVYTAPRPRLRRRAGLAEFTTERGRRYLAIVQLWKNSWAQYHGCSQSTTPVIRQVICTIQHDQCQSTPATTGRSARGGTSPTNKPR